MTARDNLVSDIIASADRVAAAMQIHSAIDALRERLIALLKEQLQTRSAELGWTLLQETEPAIKWSGFRLRFGNGDRAYFKLEFVDNARYSSWFGIFGKKPSDVDYADFQNVLTRVFNRGKASHASPWYRSPSTDDEVLPITGNWYGSDDPWIGIVKETLAPKIIDAAQRFYDVLKPEGLVGKP